MEAFEDCLSAFTPEEFAIFYKTTQELSNEHNFPCRLPTDIDFHKTVIEYAQKCAHAIDYALEKLSANKPVDKSAVAQVYKSSVHFDSSNKCTKISVTWVY
jgi:isopropylmalate/homocitrate/citramalate synthase